MLPTNHSPKLFYNFDLKRIPQFDGDFYYDVFEINQTWHDIEYLNFLFHKSFGQMASETNNQEQIMLFQSSKILSSYFYIHLEIIRKIFEVKLLRKISDPKFKSLFNTFGDKFWDSIAIARNNILIHKEKPNYIKKQLTVEGTDPESFIVIEINYKDPSGKLQKIALRPLQDIAMAQKFLSEFQNLFNATSFN